MNNYMRLTKAPEWVLQYPQCSACLVDLETDGDGWTCPGCGSSWDMDAGDGDTGTLYADWAGEEPDGPSPSSDREAAAWAYYKERLAAHERWGEQYPALYPKPVRPAWVDAE